MLQCSSATRRRRSRTPPTARRSAPPSSRSSAPSPPRPRARASPPCAPTARPPGGSASATSPRCLQAPSASGACRTPPGTSPPAALPPAVAPASWATAARSPTPTPTSPRPARTPSERASTSPSRSPMPVTTRVVHKTVVERGCGCDYAVVSSTVDVRAQCAGDLTAADCARCVQVSAQAVGWDLDAARGDGGAAAAVVGFNCHVQFEVSTALVPRRDQSYRPSGLVVGLLALSLILTVADYWIPSRR